MNDFFYLQSKEVCLYFYLNRRIEFLVELNSDAKVTNVEVKAGSAVERRRRLKMAAKKKATKKKATKKKATKKKAKKK